MPFVGDAGKLLDKQIAAMREYAAGIGVDFPASPYVCNVLKCRPPGNKLLSDGSDLASPGNPSTLWSWGWICATNLGYSAKSGKR